MVPARMAEEMDQPGLFAHLPVQFAMQTSSALHHRWLLS